MEIVQIKLKNFTRISTQWMLHALRIYKYLIENMMWIFLRLQLNVKFILKIVEWLPLAIYFGVFKIAQTSLNQYGCRSANRPGEDVFQEQITIWVKGEGSKPREALPNFQNDLQKFVTSIFWA